MALAMVSAALPVCALVRRAVYRSRWLFSNKVGLAPLVMGCVIFSVCGILFWRNLDFSVCAAPSFGRDLSARFDQTTMVMDDILQCRYLCIPVRHRLSDLGDVPIYIRW